MLLKHSAIYLAARGVPGVLNLVAIALYTRLLPSEEYGRYVLILAGAGLGVTILFSWLQMALIRYYPIYEQDPAPLLRTVATILMGLLTTTALITFAIAWIAGRTHPELKPLLLYGWLVMSFSAWFDHTLALKRVLLRPAEYALMTSIKAILATSVGVGTAILVERSFVAPLAGLIVGAGTASVLFGGLRWIQRLSVVDPNTLRELFRYGAPFTFTFALSFVVSSSDRFLLAGFLNESAAGIYAAAYDLSQQTITMLLMTVNLAAFPLVLRALEAGGVPAAQSQLRANFSLLMGVGFPATAGLAILSPNIAHIFLGLTFREQAQPIIPWIAFAALLAGVRSYYFDQAFQLTRTTVHQVWIMGLAAFVNIALNMFWIPKLGLMGAVYSTVIAYLIALGASVYWGRSVFPIPFPLIDFLKIVVSTSGMIVVLFPLCSFLGANALILQVAAGILTYGTLLGLLNLRRIRRCLLGGVSDA